jgi:hypothetical protein
MQVWVVSWNIICALSLDADTKQTSQTQIFCHPFVIKKSRRISSSSNTFTFVILLLSRGYHYLILPFRFSDSDVAHIAQIRPLRVHFNEHKHAMSSLSRYAFHSAGLCSFAWYLLFINQTKVNLWVNVKCVRSLLGFSHGGSTVFNNFPEVPNHTLGYQNHSVVCYHFGRPRLCVYTAHSSSTDTR